MKEARQKRPYTVLFHLYEISRIGKFIETESRLVVAMGWGDGEMGSSANGGGVLGGDENILGLDCGDDFITLWIC